MEIKKHAIQLQSIQFYESSFKINKELRDDTEPIEPKFSIATGYEFLEDKNVIYVGIRIKTDEDKTARYSLFVEMVGIFNVNESFSKEYIPHWAQNNGFYILLPFIRQHVYSLTASLASVPYIIPLM